MLANSFRGYTWLLWTFDGSAHHRKGGTVEECFSPYGGWEAESMMGRLQGQGRHSKSKSMASLVHFAYEISLTVFVFCLKHLVHGSWHYFGGVCHKLQELGPSWRKETTGACSWKSYGYLSSLLCFLPAGREDPPLSHAPSSIMLGSVSWPETLEPWVQTNVSFIFSRRHFGHS